MSASILSGSRLIWLFNKSSWSVVTSQVSSRLQPAASCEREGRVRAADTQAPAMGTMWILTVVQLPLLRAVICLAIVGAWTWWTGMTLQP
jgi:hypothetical protein